MTPEEKLASIDPEILDLAKTDGIVQSMVTAFVNRSDLTWQQALEAAVKAYAKDRKDTLLLLRDALDGIESIWSADGAPLVVVETGQCRK